MLAREYRFPFIGYRPKNFLSLPFFTIKYGLNNLSHYRAAIVISKSVDKRAAVRNRIKRVLSSLIQKHIDYLLPLDIIIYAKKDIAGQTKEQIEQTLLESINKINLYK